MPTVATIEGVTIDFFFNEHPAPHFHAVHGEFRAAIPIDEDAVLKGFIPPAKFAMIGQMEEHAERGASCRLRDEREPYRSGSSQMTDIVRIVSAEPVIHGVLKTNWNDGFEGIVDIRHLLAIGKVHTPPRDPVFFQTVKVSEYGHSIEWIDADGRQIDFGAGSLQTLSRTQADLVLKASRAA
jgi:hypothetical protein